MCVYMGKIHAFLRCVGSSLCRGI